MSSASGPVSTFARPSKVAPGRFVEAERELVLGQAGQTLGETIDGVVLFRQRAVPAGALRLQAKAQIRLLAGLHGHADPLALFHVPPAGVEIQAVRDVHQIATIRQEPGDAIGVAGLFVGRKGNHDVAVRNESLRSQVDQDSHQAGRRPFDVEDAPSIEETVPLSQLERVQSFRPAFTRRGDDVQMRDQQNGLGLPASA